jgi:hypothetical protein
MSAESIRFFLIVPSFLAKYSPRYHNTLGRSVALGMTALDILALMQHMDDVNVPTG